MARNRNATCTEPCPLSASHCMATPWVSKRQRRTPQSSGVPAFRGSVQERAGLEACARIQRLQSLATSSSSPLHLTPIPDGNLATRQQAQCCPSPARQARVTTHRRSRVPSITRNPASEWTTQHRVTFHKRLPTTRAARQPRPPCRHAACCAAPTRHQPLLALAPDESTERSFRLGCAKSHAH